MDLSKLTINASASSADVTTGRENATQDVLAEILQWSTQRPGWRRDALRRLFTSGKLSEEDMRELADLARHRTVLRKRRARSP